MGEMNKMKNTKNINTIEDLYKMLDRYTDGVEWNEFYSERKYKAPFVIQNRLPDENLVEILNNNKIKSALELGCGEGRNAVYMAKNNVTVSAVDLSDKAINNAKIFANENSVSIDFKCGNVFDMQFENQFDFIYDSGMFHHLTPHRRLSYLDLLNKYLKAKGYFSLCCFAEGEDCADEVDDYDFYKSRRVGVAFSKERLKEFFGKMFNVIEIRRYRNGVPNTIQGLEFMWVCLFQKK